MPLSLSALCTEVGRLARDTGRQLKQEREMQRPEAESKGSNDFVTRFDKQSEATLVKALSALLPEAGFIAEEGTSSKRGERYNWVIDPIDGTTNFIHGLYPWCISLALMDGPEVVLGVVYEAGLDECFRAWKNGGAWLNEQAIAVSKCQRVADSLIATGFPYTNFGKMEQFMQSMDFFMKNSHGLRRLGSAAADLAYVACGRFDGFYEYDLKAWDVAAGALLIKEAGGQVSDFSGGDNWLFGREVVSANAGIFKELQQRIEELLN